MHRQALKATFSPLHRYAPASPPPTLPSPSLPSLHSSPPSLHRFIRGYATGPVLLPSFLLLLFPSLPPLYLSVARASSTPSPSTLPCRCSRMAKANAFASSTPPLIVVLLLLLLLVCSVLCDVSRDAGGLEGHEVVFDKEERSLAVAPAREGGGANPCWAVWRGPVCTTSQRKPIDGYGTALL